MIAKLTGILDTIATQQVILDVRGVGYLVHCSQKTMDALPSIGQDTTLLIETVVREDAFILYGFHNQEEKDCFSLLTSVQGVGMKMGLAILSALTPSQIYQAISQGEKAILTQAEGVGPKLATRIVNELKDKINKINFNSLLSPPLPSVENQSLEDAIAALTSLGYKYNDVVYTLNALEIQNLSTQDLIRLGLAQLSRKVS